MQSNTCRVNPERGGGRKVDARAPPTDVGSARSSGAGGAPERVFESEHALSGGMALEPPARPRANTFPGGSVRAGSDSTTAIPAA